MNPETSNTSNAATRRAPRRGPGPVPLYEKPGEPERIAAILFEGMSAGNTMVEIAKEIGVTVSQVYRWLGEDSERNPTLRIIQEAARLGQQAAVERVEKALQQTACGEFDVTSRRKKTGPDGNLVEAEELTKRLAPNPLAQMFFLKNRAPGRWLDDRQVNVRGRIDVVHAIECPIPAEVVGRLAGAAPAGLLLEPGSDAESFD